MRDFVLVIDQDSLERRFISAAIAADGLNVIQQAGAVDGILGAVDWRPSLIVLGEDTGALRLSDVLALLQRLSSAPVIVVGGGGSPGELDSLALGGTVYLTRPLSASNLLLRVRSVLGREQAQDRREAHLDSKDFIDGSSLPGLPPFPFGSWTGRRSA